MRPQIGQLVTLRHRYFYVNDVSFHKGDSKLTIESIDEETLGQTMEIIWERENEKTKKLWDSDTFPDIHAPFDNPQTIHALTNAINWSSHSFLFGASLTAPLKGAIDIEDYQLEPVSRAVKMPRVNLLIADDVGLGKTIEAGLIVQEMLHRGRIKKILIVAPASLLYQWQAEMQEKFGLDFKIIDREELLGLRREYGINANPFTSHPRLIISMDYLKKEQVKQLFKSSTTSHSQLKRWDLLILDEAHNTVPSGKQKYIKDSERTKLVHDIAPEFEHRLFLTATPHNGHTESFTALLESLDPIRFSRGPKINETHLKNIMIRRLKENIESKKSFAKRTIQALSIDATPAEEHLHSLLDEYIELRMKNNQNAHTVAFAMTILKKRALSSPKAFYSSIVWHQAGVDEIDESAITDQRLLLRLEQLAKEDYSNDMEKDQNEEIATVESTKATKSLTPEEKRILNEIVLLAKEPKDDTKIKETVAFIKANLFENGKWKPERLIIFTEYKDTMEYLLDALRELDDGGRFITLSGGATLEEREVIKHIFQESPFENRTRILIATDAASEGLNLQNHCRFLIHYEIPWNPNKMEQRNGRIDRFGQKFDEVFISHFSYKNRRDSEFLNVIITKTEQMRSDLGAISEIIEKNLQNAMIFGASKELDFGEGRQAIIHQDIKHEIKTKISYAHILDELNASKEALHYTPKNLKELLDAALKLHALPPLVHSGELIESYILKEVPLSWKIARESMLDKDGNKRKLIFDATLKEDRNDVILLHLSHPLVKYAIADFRKRLFPTIKEKNIARISYKVVDGLDKVYIECSTRVLALSQSGSLIHEELVFQNFALDNGRFTPSSKALSSLPFSFSEIPLSLSEKLRSTIDANKESIKGHMNTIVSQKVETLKETLKQKASEHIKVTKALIKERLAEIEERIKVMRGDIQKQVNLFTTEEEIQYKDDLRWLEYRRDDLLKRQDDEPTEIKNEYTIKDTKEFFLCVVVYIPKSEVK